MSKIKSIRKYLIKKSIDVEKTDIKAIKKALKKYKNKKYPKYLKLGYVRYVLPTDITSNRYYFEKKIKEI